MSPVSSSRSEWRAHGWILAPCLAGMLLCSVINYSLGVMLDPLEQQFGWTRAEISVGPLIISLASLGLAPLVGLLVDRFGARPVGLFGAAFYCGAIALLATATQSLLHWWTLWAIIAVAGMLAGPVVWTTAVNRHFDKNRGKALAITLCGTGIAATVVPWLTSELVDWKGWRFAYVGLAVIFACLVLPLVVFLFSEGTAARGQRHRPAGSDPQRSVSRHSMGSPRFIKLAVAAAMYSLASASLSTNGFPILMGEGFSRTAAVGIIGLIGIGSIIGRLSGGYLLDRFDARIVAAISVSAPILSASLLLLTQDSQLAASLSCLILGLSVGTELDACAYLTARHFGMRHFGGLFGIIVGLLFFVNGVGPMASNLIYDLTGSYRTVLYAIIPACAISASLFLLLGRYPEAADADDPAALPARPALAS